MFHWKSILGVVLVFVLGCVAGALVCSAFFMHRSAVFFQRGAPAYVEVLERRFTRGLDLDLVQREKIHAIFMSNLEQRQQLQKQIQPQIQVLNLGTVQQVKAILRPDQVEGFRKNVLDFRHRFGRGRGNPRALDALGPAPVSEEPATNATSQ